ncbi:LytR/AlgR family response regulator transcription factor [Aequorivita antarctica]|uniref:Response regulator transcription factor n=1 Tax=Aequorivita antarctica TaxID=153266 RepID=A0A5C6Z0S6_9FLAO|nr:LytTR family DNA-binding domain-containing protein [Aequorivita antarctica]TXD73037.1 response regulator transcription factor [Aequorivita antarctica]SRX74556.1 Transcriptional regulatory protein YehT [Aequorivita antarctica]
MNLRAIIVDDEKHSRETLNNLVIEFCEDVEVLTTVSNIEDAVLAIKTLKPDLLFLDIELQTGTGFDILEQLNEVNFEVIFTTAFEQYALKAVKFSSLDYLLKPIDLDELQKAVEKAKKIKDRNIYSKQLETLIHNLKQQQPINNKICLATADGYEFINVEEIMYCKAEGSYTSFKLISGINLLVSKHLKEYENLLTDQYFMRVHNSYLINLNEVKKYVKADGGYILMNNGEPVSISRSKKEDFFKIMNLS